MYTAENINKAFENIVGEQIEQGDYDGIKRDFWDDLNYLAEIPSGPPLNQDELEQWAANNATARLAAFLESIAISALAAQWGPGAKRGAASCLKYATRTVSRLAALHDLPQDLIDLEVKVGLYWAAIQHSDNPVEVIRHALNEGWTTAGEVKRYLGVAKEKEPPLLVAEVELEITDGVAVIRAESIRPEDGYPERCKVRLTALSD